MELIVMNPDLVKTAVIDVIDSMIWTDRYFSAGDFEIFTPINQSMIAALQEDYYLTMKDSEHTMVIESINLRTDIEEGNKLVVTGRSLESILDRRIVWQQTVLSGSLQNGIRQLLEENAINPDDPDRRISRLIFEESDDPNVSNLSVDAQFTGDSLYDAIQKLCEANNIGFKITISTDGSFIFKLYAGADRSFNQITNAFVSFSPNLDNLSNSNYFHSKKPYKTVTLVAGEGEGSDRLTATVVLPDGGGSDLNRREKFTDARDVSTLVNGETLPPETYYTLLYQRGLISLVESLPISSFDGKIDASRVYVYGRDFFMGDIVQVENEYGLKGKSRVVELIFSEDLSGRDIYPTFQSVE